MQFLQDSKCQAGKPLSLKCFIYLQYCIKVCFDLVEGLTTSEAARLFAEVVLFLKRLQYKDAWPLDTNYH